MDVYVNDPKKMNQSKLLLEALNLSKLTMQRIAMCLDFMALCIGKVEHPSFAWFCILEMKTSKTLSQELTQLHVIIS